MSKLTRSLTPYDIQQIQCIVPTPALVDSVITRSDQQVATLLQMVVEEEIGFEELKNIQSIQKFIADNASSIRDLIAQENQVLYHQLVRIYRLTYAQEWLKDYFNITLRSTGLEYESFRWTYEMFFEHLFSTIWRVSTKMRKSIMKAKVMKYQNNQLHDEVSLQFSYQVYQGSLRVEVSELWDVSWRSTNQEVINHTLTDNLLDAVKTIKQVWHYETNKRIQIASILKKVEVDTDTE